MPTHKIGFVYVMSNYAMPDYVNVGRSARLPEDRTEELYTTGVPEPFGVDFRMVTSRPIAVERRAHQLLGAHRPSPRREFFRVPPETAIEAVRQAAVEAAGIGSWDSPYLQYLAAGDRVILTLEAGQIFLLMAYPHFFAKSAEFVDIWQAHSHGDLLEIYVTSSGRHVAGFSDRDVGSTSDPVPFLDRDNDVANGVINGRERLVPGDRLLWLGIPTETDDCAYVIFEAKDYCQVLSRTWNPQTDIRGVPLVLGPYSKSPV